MTRSPEYIAETMKAIEHAWLAHSYLRLGQLIAIAANPANPCPELFHARDAALVVAAQKIGEKKDEPESIEPITDAEKAQLEKLNPTDTFYVKALLILRSTRDWQKTARVVGAILFALQRDGISLPYAFVADCLEDLIDAGQIEVQGEVRQMRHSEIRLKL